jgi:hypothetical protein
MDEKTVEEPLFLTSQEPDRTREPLDSSETDRGARCMWVEGWFRREQRYSYIGIDRRWLQPQGCARCIREMMEQFHVGLNPRNAVLHRAINLMTKPTDSMRG